MRGGNAENLKAEKLKSEMGAGVRFVSWAHFSELVDRLKEAEVREKELRKGIDRCLGVLKCYGITIPGVEQLFREDDRKP